MAVDVTLITRNERRLVLEALEFILDRADAGDEGADLRVDDQLGMALLRERLEEDEGRD